MKKLTSAILAFLMALNLLTFTAFASEEYVIGFNTEEETQGITASTGIGSAVDYDDGCGALVVRPNFAKNLSVTVGTDGAKMADKRYVKVRYLFMDTFCSDAKMLMSIGGTQITIDNFNGKKYGRWYEAIAETDGAYADSITLTPAYATDDLWTTTGNICIDYIGFFSSYDEAAAFSEPDDTEYYPSYNPEEENGTVALSKDDKFLKGYANARSFRPEANISRAESAAMLSRIITSSKKADTLPFADVSDDSWYAEDVSKLLANGIVSQDSTFRPDDAVTRGEFVSMIFRLGIFDIMKSAYFADVAKDEFYYRPVVAAAGNGAVNGYSDGTFRPNNAITRAEAVVILNRITGNSESDSVPEGQLYDDVAPTYWAYRDIMLASSGASLADGSGEGDGEVTLLNGIFDQYNSKGNVWEPVPFVTKEMKEAGNIGGEGGQIQVHLSIDSTGDFLITHADVGNTQRSIDGGKTWEDCGRGLGDEGSNWSAIDPNNSARVLAVTRNGADDTTVRRYKNTFFGLYLSDDYAEHFDQVMIYSDREMHRDRQVLAWDPTSYDEKIGGSAVAYYSTETATVADNFIAASKYEQEQGYNEGVGLYRSDDGGHTWKMVNKDMAKASINVSYDDGTVYAVKDGSLYRSTNKGETFTLAQSGIIYADTIKTQPKYVYGISEGGVYVSKNNGVSFDKQGSAPLLGTAGVRDFKVSPADPDRMALGRRSALTTDNYDIVYTHDGGSTWQTSTYVEESNIYEQEPRSKYIAWHPTDPDKLWTNADWVESSTDGGKTLYWDFNGGVGTCINCWWRPSTINSDYWLVPAQDFSGVVSFDGGETFKKLRDFAVGQGFSHVYGGCVVDENTMFVALTRSWEANTLELRGTHDGGKTWESYGTITTGFRNCRFFQWPADPKVIFAGNMRSSDGGYNWEKMDEVQCASTYSKKSPTVFGIGTDTSKIMKSDDGGATWTVYTTGETIEGREWGGIQYGIDYDYDNDILYYPKYGGIYKVTKDGKTTSLRENMFASGAEFWCSGFSVDPIHPEVLYATGIGTTASYYSKYENMYVALRSCDSGETWQVISSVDKDKTIVKDGPAVGRGMKRTCFVHPDTGYFYLSTANNGLWKIAPPYELDK